ncbi:hypothetical protein F5X96DRAFT_629944 [Biscogniauxia mediterranea]|nr:hypothetical protein F5X96DRAFT_629944 [Biscogniauxia mediterranea]
MYTPRSTAPIGLFFFLNSGGSCSTWEQETVDLGSYAKAARISVSAIQRLGKRLRRNINPPTFLTNQPSNL